MRNFLQRRRNSFVVAWAGLVLFFKSETHARIHLMATVLVLGLGWLCSVTAYEWMAIILAIGLVVQAEVWNTIFEKTADFIHPDYEPRIKVIKDLAASAVLWCSICAVVIGLIIFFPYFRQWL